MIYKRMSGRLGNQMFQYAAIRSFQYKYRKNDQVVLDFRDVYKLGSKKEGFRNSLDGFNLNSNVVFSDNFKMDFIPWILFLIYKLLCGLLKITDFNYSYLNKRKMLENIIYPFYHKQGLYIYTDGFKDFDNCEKKNVYFFGYFESVKYFDNICDILRDEFSSKVDLSKNELFKIIMDSNCTCISVRAGDFLSDKFFNDYYICDNSYYNNAINYIENVSSNNLYIVFSDDIEWVKKNLIFPKNINIIYENPGYNLYEKIYLMIHCKNYILSNSSFSFWTQFMSFNKKKIVVAPNRWSNKNKNIDIYEESWIKIPVERNENKWNI